MTQCQALSLGTHIFGSGGTIFLSLRPKPNSNNRSIVNSNNRSGGACLAYCGMPYDVINVICDLVTFLTHNVTHSIT